MGIRTKYKKFRKTRSTRQKGGDNVNAKDANGSTALIRASWDGDTEIVRMLLEKGADVNAKDAKGSTALMKASLNGHTKVVSMLLEKGADVNAKDNNGSTALMKATLHGHTEIVRMLLEKGADVNVKTGYGSTALVLASWDGDTEIVRMLLEKGADVNAKDADGSTALIKASWDGHTEIVRMLLEKGADVNAKDNDGSTALIKASLNGHTKVVSMLLEKGADVNAKNNAGNTAFFLANRRFLENRPEYTEIVKLLKQYIVTQSMPPHLKRQEDRKYLGIVLQSVRGTSNRGPDGKLPTDIIQMMEGDTSATGPWNSINSLLGGKRKTKRKIRNSKKSNKRPRKHGRKTRKAISFNIKGGVPPSPTKITAIKSTPLTPTRNVLNYKPLTPTTMKGIFNPIDLAEVKKETDNDAYLQGVRTQVEKFKENVKKRTQKTGQDPSNKGGCYKKKTRKKTQ